MAIRYADLLQWEPALGAYKKIDGNIPISVLTDYGYTKLLFLAKSDKKIKKIDLSGFGSHDIFFSTRNEDPKFWHSIETISYLYPTSVLYLWIRAPKTNSFASTNSNISSTLYSIDLDFLDSNDIIQYDTFGPINGLENITPVYNNPYFIFNEIIYLAHNSVNILQSLNHGSLFSGFPTATGYNVGNNPTLIKKIFGYDLDNIYVAFRSGDANTAKITKVKSTLESSSLEYQSTKDFGDLIALQDANRTIISAFINDGIYKATESSLTFTEILDTTSITDNTRLYSSDLDTIIRCWFNPLTSRTYRYSDDSGDTWSSNQTSEFYNLGAISVPNDGLWYIGSNSVNKINNTNIETNIFGHPNFVFENIANGFGYTIISARDIYNSNRIIFLAHYENEWRYIPAYQIKGLNPNNQSFADLSSFRQMFITNDRSLFLLTLDGYFVKLNLEDLFTLSGTKVIKQTPFNFNALKYADSASNIVLPPTNTTSFEIQVRFKLNLLHNSSIINCPTGSFKPELNITSGGGISAEFGGLTLVYSQNLVAGQWYIVSFGYNGTEIFIKINDDIEVDVQASYTNTGNTIFRVGDTVSKLNAQIDYIRYEISSSITHYWDFNEPKPIDLEFEIYDQILRAHLTTNE